HRITSVLLNSYFYYTKDKVKENLGNAHNKVSSYFDVKVYNEEKLFDESNDLYVSIDFTFPSLFIYGINSTSGIYKYIAEYANKHSVKIVSVSAIRNIEESNSSHVSVIFEKLDTIT
ncbi:MAG: hypothetical protein ACTIJA_08335, partial [Bavariicoccus seileri]|uniref:hypothetical protein n=1 Tax=Bavariicoccus seileri TaxID=549685 RepID=UPI003F948037